MKILYIYRHPDMGFSIGKVFRPIENEFKKYADVDSVYLPVPNYSFKGLWMNIRCVLKYCKKKKYDIIHITGSEHYLLPFLINEKVIITIHDVGFYTNNKRSYKNILKYILWIKSLPLASYITFISEKTKNEVLRFVNLKSDRYSVVFNPISSEFINSPKVFNKEYPTILHIGTGSNKNIETTAIALKGFPCKLNIVGKLTEGQKMILNLYQIDYECVYGLTDNEILDAYRNCDIVNFPSLYEGFGMPIIEGQSIGRPVLTSNLSPMNEVAGNASVLVDPVCPNSIRAGYDFLLTQVEDYIEKGFENVKRFALPRIVKQYLDIYNKIL